MLLEKKNQILDETVIRRKIKRITYEIFEKNFQEKELVLAGVVGTGFNFARLIYDELKKISPFEIKLVKITLDKNAPLSGEVSLDVDINQMRNKTIVIIDDVLYTGHTFMQSLKPFLDIEINRIQTAVLINRSHKMFPIAADFVGYELSTTVKETIKVMLNDENLAVFLY
ncbi:MAG: phosphoribosyltransferase family protein [Cyclobacteriaceae bacterium]